ncbi:MAG: ribose-phosphate pyrophosphokinase [Gammaproteobacteria bacterium]
MSVKICSLFDSPVLKALGEAQNLNICKISYKTFPDGESYLRFEEDITGDHLILIDSLNTPNPKLLPMVFFAETARKLGASQVGLIAPYLAYMRQDIAFNPGESVTSVYYAELISRYFDWLVTVDPHLHRYRSLSEIYSIKSKVVSATQAVADWIKTNISNAILIGPDSESEQWVSKIAEIASVPYVILKKERLGDRDVEITFDRGLNSQGKTPVLVDDIISTATTMVETIKQLKKINITAPVCIGVHAVFSEDAYESLIHAGAQKIVTCNTIAHHSNQIDITNTLIKPYLEIVHSKA